MKAIGIILAGGNSNRMRELSKKRAIAAMPVGGCYRSIDFAISNMSNSHIQKLAVLTQYNARSLNEHLSSSKWWDFGRKQGGLYVFNPTITSDNGFWYRGTADAIYQNLDYLKNSHEPYVVIASGDGIYKMDYSDMLDYHIDKKADITVACTTVTGNEDASRFGIVTTDSNNRITDFDEKPIVARGKNISIGVYVIRRRLLIDMIEQAQLEERHDFVRDILVRNVSVKKIYAYQMNSYWSNISTVESYFRTNMDFLKKEVRDHFFKDGDIYSKIDDLPPAKHNPGSLVKNSLISSGCIVNGYVENSVVFKKVYVGNNTTIKNSIILNDVHIGDNVYIENCIVESRDTIKANSHYVGENGKIRVVVEKSDRY